MITMMIWRKIDDTNEFNAFHERVDFGVKYLLCLVFSTCGWNLGISIVVILKKDKLMRGSSRWVPGLIIMMW